MSESAPGSHAARWVERILAHRATPWVIAALFVAHGIWSIRGDRHLHDEGLLTYVFAAWLREAPLATLFFQKARAITCLVYAPSTLLGYDGFFIAHVLVAASAIPMLARIAVRLELPLPALPALFLAASPMYLGSAPAGLSNADGVVATVLFLFVLIGLGRPLLAGIVLGSLPWVRNELLLLVLIFAVYGAIWQRRLLAGVFVFPLLYGLAGAVYHGQLLWQLSYPPALLSAMPGNPVYVGELASFGVAKVGLTLMAISPTVVLAPMIRREWVTREEGAFLIFAAVYFVAMNVLPIWQIFNFGFTPRYSLGLLPAFALCGGRVAGAWWHGKKTGSATLPILGLAFAAGLLARSATPAVLWLAVAATSLVALAVGNRGRAAALALVVATLAVMPALDEAAHVSRRARYPQLGAVVDWLAAHRERARAGPIVTDITILDALLKRSAGMPELDVRHLVGADQRYEVEQLSNPHNGQRARLFEAMGKVFFGRPVFPDQLTPEALPETSLFVLSRDDRLRLIMKEPTWRDRLRVVFVGERFRIAELAPKP